MASNPVQINTGTTIGFGTSAFTAELTSINLPEATRKTIPTTHLGTAAPGAAEIGNATSIPGDIVDMSEIEIEGHFNPDTVPPVDEAIETITITLKDGATWVCQGYMTKYAPEVGGDVDEKMTFTASIMPAGPVTVTAAV